ncbi:MAG TPA: AI-2E family transporter [Pseudomonas xinjiangensis]|uniref:AI-2E family transporter n=2 Tax=root TaxID=1 RepID=A0A7V1FS12_9GAMM|nr:AI-2E family transporter [Halopseudomonas xinjiangensis]HEC48550.1 AI-2E family transporter [Halopseudomonas xinjiangensis]
MTEEDGIEPFVEAPEGNDPGFTSLPQPRPSKSLVWLLGLALLYTLYFAKTLLLPLVVAVLFALLLGPLVTLLKRLYIPRVLSAVLILSALLGPFTLLTVELAEPAQKWAKRLPEISKQLTEELDVITDSLQGEVVVMTEPVQPVVEEAEEPEGLRLFGWFRRDAPEEAEPEPPPAPAVPDAVSSAEQVSDRIKQGGMELLISILGATPMVIAQFVTTIILILFILVFGPNLFSAFVDHFPRVKDKQRSVILVSTIQRELSRYILTVSAINALLGLSTGAALWLLDVEDALLWGAFVGLANFAPYIGPVIGIIVLCLAGLVQYGPEPSALVPALVFFTINLAESQFVTPMVLGRNMRLNPLVIMIWLLIWGWLWGAAGVLLAVPLLVCLKLAFGQMNYLPDWVKLIETRA